jgi:catechol 2,3-dioxygenase-like lactoylglutathione lyase family enzyme
MNQIVNIDVDDLEKATCFYTSAFGLRVGTCFGSFGVEMLSSSAPIYLGQGSGKSTVAGNHPGPKLRSPLDARAS